MRREFNSKQFGNEYRAVVTIGDVLGRKLLQGVLSVRTGFGGSSRRLKSIFLDHDTDDLAKCEAALRRENAMEPFAFADVLQELGWDDVFCDVIRRSQ